MNEVEDIFQKLAELLCSDAVKIDVARWAGGVSVSIHPTPSDFGKVVGKAGATYASIRFMAHAVEMVQKRTIQIGVFKPDGAPNPPGDFAVSSSWDPAPAFEMAVALCRLLFEDVSFEQIETSQTESIGRFDLKAPRETFVKVNGEKFTAALDRILYAIGRTRKRFLRTSVSIDGEPVHVALMK